MIQRTEENWKHYDDLFHNGVLPEAAYRDLVARAENQMREYHAELERIQHAPG